MIELEVDPAKEAINLAKHRISLWRFADMDFATALTNAARTLTEQRYAVIGEIDGKLWTGIVTYRSTRTRVISLRRANKKERRLYAEAISH